MNKTVQVAGNFVPFGTVCLMLGDAVRIIDSTAQPQLLQTTESQLFNSIQRAGGDEESAPLVIQCFLVDHRVQSYKNVLRTALQSMVPLLFMGGKVSDYQPMVVQRQSPTARQHNLQNQVTVTVSYAPHTLFRVVHACVGC